MEKKIAGITFTSTGVCIEKPYCINNENLKGQNKIKEEKFTGELLVIAKRAIKYRMAHCYKQLHQNLASAEVITKESIIWKGGHFEVPVFEAMEGILKLQDVRDLNTLQCQQLIRALMFNVPNYWLEEHDANWNKVKGAENVQLTEEFKMFVTEHMLVCKSQEFRG